MFPLILFVPMLSDRSSRGSNIPWLLVPCLAVAIIVAVENRQDVENCLDAVQNEEGASLCGLERDESEGQKMMLLRR